MIVLSDNDIILKLAGCCLLNDFFDILKADAQDILITDAAGYALPKQAKRKFKSNESALKQVSQFVNRVGRVNTVNYDLLSSIQGLPNMDVGESLLVLATYENPDAYLATGDKRCLKSLIDNKFSKPMDDIFNCLINRVYCLETAFLLLIEHLGFEKVNELVTKRNMGKIDDTVLKIAFGTERGIDDAIDCLSSYCKELQPLLVHVASMNK